MTMMFLMKKQGILIYLNAYHQIVSFQRSQVSKASCVFFNLFPTLIYSDINNENDNIVITIIKYGTPINFKALCLAFKIFHLQLTIIVREKKKYS